jgi:CBS domain-containing protein
MTYPMTASDLMSDVFIPLEQSDSVSVALRQMDENKVSHLPLVEDKKFLGLISEHDLFSVEDESLSIDDSHIIPQRLFVNHRDHYYAALKTITENKLSIVPVIDDSNLYLGSILGQDILRAAADTMSVLNPGGIIILSVKHNDFSLSEISRIIESNDCKILSTGINSIPNTNMLQITLKLNKINIESVIQTLNRFEYTIDAYFGENKKDEDLLRDRYDALMMYLKV